MKNKINKSTMLTFIIFVSLTLSIVFSHSINSSFNTIHIEKKIINVKSNPSIATLIYTPKTNLEYYPVVILTHGIINSKEVSSNIGLELARRGIIAVSVDQYGHGDSGGSLSSQFSSLGVLQVLEYVYYNLSNVDNSRIGVVGHSMGCGNLLAAMKDFDAIKSTVFIGGGVNRVYSNDYLQINVTQPKNLLVAIASNDELFDIDGVRKSLMPVFNSDEIIEVGKLYGSFINNTARKLITPKTTHLFEPLDKRIVASTVEWMIKALMDTNFVWDSRQETLLYPIREYTNLLSLLLFIILFIMLSYSFVSNKNPFTNIKNEFEKNKEEDEEQEQGCKQEKKDQLLFEVNRPCRNYFIWILLHVFLFIIFLPIGFFTSLFNGMYIDTAFFWLLSLAAVGSLLLYLSNKERFKDYFAEFLGIKHNKEQRVSLFTNLLLSIIFSFSAVSLIVMLDSFYYYNFKLIIPLFNSLHPKRIIFAIGLFIPMVLYFSIDSIFLVSLDNIQNIRHQKAIAKTILLGLLKNSLFLIVLFIQYFPLLLFNYQPIKGSLAFSLQFLFIIIPLLFIFNIFSCFFVRNSNSFLPSAIFNSCLFSLALSSIVPLI